MPAPERRALFALLHGTGIEVSVALGLTRADVHAGTREVRAAGTKAHTRDRVALVADWAWPIVAAHVADLLPAARLFPVAWSRWTVSDWQRRTAGDGVEDTHGRVVKPAPALTRRYPLHAARNHGAVRQFRAGTPVALVQAQPGHESPVLTLRKYGRFAPSSTDRARWEAAATADDVERAEQARVDRGSAVDGANGRNA